MKTFVKAFALSCALTASPAQAGSLSDPVIEQDIIIAEATSSSSGTALVALLAVVLAIPQL